MSNCPRCGSIMIEQPPAVIYTSNPPQYDKVMWCGCGHTENHGRVTAPTPEQSMRDQWESLNKGTTP